MSEITSLTQEQKEQLAERIYGYFVNILKLPEAVVSRIEIDFTYNPPPQSSTIIENASSSDDVEVDSDDVEVAFPVASASFSIGALRCVPGPGNGCWDGYRLG